jgi:hypothetical protein
MPRRRRLLHAPILLSLLLIGAIPAGRAAEGINPRFGFIARQFIVPAPEGVTIDGDLGDWDRSGSVESFPSFHERETRRVHLAMMHDAEALYIGGRVADESPLMNRHDPDANPDKVWNGDSCQVRLVIDRDEGYPVSFNKFNKDQAGTDDIVHLLLWYYTDGERPGLQLRRDMSYTLPAAWGEHGMVTPDGFAGVYRRWEEGSGYTFEYRIPWATLEAPNAPRAGDVVAGTTQLNWSRADGLAIDKGGYARNVVSSGGFPFQTSDCWGKFIFARRGDLPPAVTEVTAGPDAAAEPPAPLTLAYALPRSGAVSLGLYDDENVLRRQILAEAEHPATGPQERAWDGLDDRGEPLPAGAYTLRGVVSDPITERFVLSVHNAGTPPYKTDDGTGGWGADHGEPTTVAAAGEAMLLAWSVAESGWGIIRSDLDGDKQWGTKHPAAYLAVSGDRFFAAGGHGNKSHGFVRVYELADARPVTFDGGASEVEVPAAATEAKTTGLAATAEVLYVAYGAADLIGVHDPRTGALRERIGIPAPGRLAVGPGGALYALSEGTRVVRIADGERRVLREGLDGAAGIAVDGEGRVFVTQTGEAQNVLVLDGETTRTIGRAGGRPRRGRFDPQGLLEPGGCAVDGRGRLWVAETLDGPKRVSVWDTATGEVADQFFGASSYFGWVWVDPQNPGEAFNHNCIWRINLETGEKQIVSTHWRRIDPNEPPAHNPGGHAGHFRVLTAANGAQVGWGMAGRSRCSVIYLRDGVLFKPFAGQVDRSYPALAELWSRLDEQWQEERIPRYKRPKRLFWQDGNDDQRVQPEEVSTTQFFTSWITPDLTLWSEHGAKLAPARFDGDRPVYDPAAIESIPVRGRHPNSTGMALADPADGIYTLWPGSEHSLAKWTAEGELLWSAGQHLNWKKALSQPPMQPGDLWGMTNILGLAGDFTGVSTYFGGYHLFTRDGVYVAMVMRPGSAPGGLGPDITASETITGQLFKPAGMERYFLGAGDQDGRITELHGLETLRRLADAPLTISAEEAKRVAEAHRAYRAARQRSGVLYIQRPGGALTERLAPVERQVDETRSFSAQLGWDRTHLHLRYEVRSPCPLVNAVEDLTLLFKGGNLLDVQLATNPGADPDREAPAPGDLRLLVSRRPDGSPVAVLLRPRVAGHGGERITLQSPTGEESFDAITAVPEVSVEVGPLLVQEGKRKRPVEDGFVATARVPLAALGWEPTSGQTLRADVGYIFGNATGNDAAVRAYWHNRSFTANVVDDIPHESRLQPQHWGTAVVE